MLESHSSAKFDLSTLAGVGARTYISANSMIRRPNEFNIGTDCAIDDGFYITTQAKIGSFIHIGPYVSIIGGISGQLIIEDFASIAAGARIICVGDEMSGFGLVGPTIPIEYQDNKVGEKIILSSHSVIGTNAVILPNSRISIGSIIGAGGVFSGETEPWTIYLGNPARPVKTRNAKEILKKANLIKLSLKIDQ